MNLDEALQGFQDKSQMFNFEEDNTIIELSLTYEKLLEGKISRNDFYELFMASFWISRHKIHPRLKVSADKGENILVELNRGWPLRAVDQIYDIQFSPQNL